MAKATCAYRQLCADICQAIIKGWYAPGDKLPTEDALCASTGLSKGTVRAALAPLETAGILRKERGSGAYIAANALANRLDFAHGRTRAIVETLMRGGMRAPEIYKLFRREQDSLAESAQSARFAFIDCTPDLFEFVELQLKSVGDYRVEAFTVDEVRIGGLMPSQACALWLTTGTHYPELEPVAKQQGVRLESVELSVSGKSLAELIKIKDNQIVGVLYRHENFLINVRYTMQAALNKYNSIYACPLEEWRTRLQLADSMDIVFVIPPMLEDITPSGIMILAHLQSLGKKAIVYEYQIDQGSLAKLRALTYQPQEAPFAGRMFVT